jgi:hypothetical protein
VRAILLLAFVLSACTSEVASDMAQNTPLTSRGTLTLSLDGQAVALEYDRLPAQVALEHRQDPAGQGCVVRASLVAQRPDGSCRLEFVYEPWIGGGGLHLDEARLTVVSTDPKVPRCAAWPEEPLAMPGDPVVYALHAGTSTLPVANVKAQAGLVAKVSGAVLHPTGVVTLKYQGRKVDLPTDALVFGGDVISKGVSALTCQGPACQSPYPKFQLRDVQPKSPLYSLTYGLEAFAHKPLIVLMVAGWCTACVYDAPRYMALRAQLMAQGHDVAWLAINMSNAATPELQKQIVSRLDIPVLQDTPSAQVYQLLGGEKTDAFLYHGDGTLSQHLLQLKDMEHDDSPGFVKVRDAILALH